MVRARTLVFNPSFRPHVTLSASATFLVDRKGKNMPDIGNAIVLLFVLLSTSTRSLPPQYTRRSLLSAASSSSLGLLVAPPALADSEEKKPKAQFQRYPQIRFIAALGDPFAKEGKGADLWGLWRDDPGPRGVYLQNFESRLAKTGIAPAGWTFQKDDWWLEEHGLIMSNPENLPRKKYDKRTCEIKPFKRYVVTGDREVTTILTVYEDGRWELKKGTLYDVTHLPCRSARYTPTSVEGSGACVPSKAERKMFPVNPGASMPAVAGCNKQDYAVLFVLGEEI